jgi:hypothetical protein
MAKADPTTDERPLNLAGPVRWPLVLPSRPSDLSGDARVPRRAPTHGAQKGWMREPLANQRETIMPISADASEVD